MPKISDFHSTTQVNATYKTTKRIKRGDNNFEPISWDQALDEIAKKMRTIKKTNGSEALGLFSGTRTGTLTNRGYIRMFSKLWGTKLRHH